MRVLPHIQDVLFDVHPSHDTVGVPASFAEFPPQAPVKAKTGTSERFNPSSTAALHEGSSRTPKTASVDHGGLRPGASHGDEEVELPPVMPLPPPPAAAAAQWAQHAYNASQQAAAARAAAAKAAEVASAQAASAQAAATQAQVAQVSAQQAAAAQVAQSLGYNVAPVGVPSAAAYGEVLLPAPPYGSAMPVPSAAAYGEMVLPAPSYGSYSSSVSPSGGSGPGPALFSGMGSWMTLHAAVTSTLQTDSNPDALPGKSRRRAEAHAFLALPPQTCC